MTRASGCTLHLPFLRKTLSSSVITLRDIDSVVEGSQVRTAVHVQIRHLDVLFAIALCGIKLHKRFKNQLKLSFVDDDNCAFEVSIQNGLGCKYNNVTC